MLRSLSNKAIIVIMAFVAIPFFNVKLSAVASDNEVIKIKPLEEFSPIAAKLQHDGWAQKDMKVIMETLPLAEKFVGDLEKIGTPKELEARSERWNKLKSNLQKTLDVYKKEIDSDNTEKLLDAVDRFGAIYLAMVAMTKPYVPEVEEFHKFMAKMFHKDYPEFNVEAMKDDLKNMKMVVGRFEQLDLPKYYKPKEQEFKKALNSLKSSIADIENYMTRIDELKKGDKIFDSKVEAIHDNFHELEEIFM